MKLRGGLVLIIILLFAGLAISPATGEIIRAGRTSEKQTNEYVVHYFFWDFTGNKPVKQTIDFKKSEWKLFSQKLDDIKTEGVSLEESINAQFEVYKEYNLIKKDVTYQTLQQKIKVRFEDKAIKKLRTRADNNSILNSMCSIKFKFETCITFVLGLNSFINIIGFNIISLHSGTTSASGIQTEGALGIQNLEQGDYFGTMFGFLGYWSGTMEGILEYSDLEVVGFTIGTLWLPS